MKNCWVLCALFSSTFCSLQRTGMRHGNNGYHNTNNTQMRSSSAPPQIPHTACRNPLNAHELFQTISPNKTLP